MRVPTSFSPVWGSQSTLASWSQRPTANWPRLALVALLVALLLPSPAALSQIRPGASLTVLRGSVAVTRQDGTAIYPAGTGLTLALGDVVGTLERTRAIVTFFTGSEIELGSNTTVVIRRLDRDLLDEANVTLENLTGLTVIRVPQNAGPAGAVRVLADDTVALVRSGELGHGVDPTSNNVTVACVDGAVRCGPASAAFPGETANLPGQIVRTRTGRGDLVDRSVPPGASVWDLLAEGGGISRQDGISSTASSGRARNAANEDDPPPTARGAATLAPPPPGTPGPACGTPRGGTGSAGTFSFVHDMGRTGGTAHIDWNAFGAGDQFEIFYEGVRLFTTPGFVANTGSADVPFGPGSSTHVVVRVTTGPGSTQWTYTIACLP